MTRGYSSIGLVEPKSHLNVGSILRCCGNFDVSMLAIEGHRYKCAATDTMSNHKHMPLIETENILSIAPKYAKIVAVDLCEGAESIIDYVHPESVFYIFGPEDGTLQPKLVEKCDDILYIPTNRCMNLSGAVHVVLYDRMLKRREVCG